MHILTFLLPFTSGLVLIPLFKMFSTKTGQFIDSADKDELKIHEGRISVLGGLAIVLSVFIGFLFTGQEFFTKLLAINFGALLFFLICLWDDLKWKSTPKSHPFLKSSMLIFSAIISAVVLLFLGINFVFFPIAIISVILSSLYIFVVVNSINYQDGADGLAGGLVLISLAGFFISGLLTNNNLLLYMSTIFFGAVLSFLIFNFPPAKIFMGDSGAYFLGFILATLAISISLPYNIYSVLGPIFIIGLPVFDGVFSNLRRIVAGKSIFFGDRNHFYDKLLKRFSLKKTLLISYALQIFFVIIGIFVYIISI